MKAIKINVNKQMDGYTFSILPSVRDLIKKSLPGAMPAKQPLQTLLKKGFMLISVLRFRILGI